jgi:hypothetical protein
MGQAPAPRYDRSVPAKRDDASEHERDAIERDERASFERRAEWWRLHYGTAADDEDGRARREAAEHADRMPKTRDD